MIESPITERDENILRCLQERKILANIEPHRLDQTSGLVLLHCSDPVRGPQVFLRHVELQRETCEHPNIFQVARPGGSLRVVADSRLNKPTHRTSLDLLDDIEIGINECKIPLVVAYAHIPCRAARLAEMDALAVVDGHATAIIRLKRTFPKVKVVPYFHGHFRNGEMEHFYFDMEQWAPQAADLQKQWGTLLATARAAA